MDHRRSQGSTCWTYLLDVPVGRTCWIGDGVNEMSKLKMRGVDDKQGLYDLGSPKVLEFAVGVFDAIAAVVLSQLKFQSR